MVTRGGRCEWEPLKMSRALTNSLFCRKNCCIRTGLLIHKQCYPCMLILLQKAVVTTATGRMKGVKGNVGVMTSLAELACGAVDTTISAGDTSP